MYGGWGHRKVAEVVKVIGSASGLWPHRLTVIVVIADCGLVINSMAVQNANCTLSLLPLSLPVSGRSESLPGPTTAG